MKREKDQRMARMKRINTDYIMFPIRGYSRNSLTLPFVYSYFAGGFVHVNSGLF